MVVEDNHLLGDNSKSPLAGVLQSDDDNTRASNASIIATHAIKRTSIKHGVNARGYSGSECSNGNTNKDCSDLDLRKSDNIIALTRSGKNHVKKLNVSHISDKCQD